MSTTADAPGLEYEMCDWGDLIKGTKAQLQAAGLAVGLAFPGEPGGPKRALKVQDHRGYAVRIEPGHRGEGRFCARLTFPGWPEAPWRLEQWEPAFPGVDRQILCTSDVYRGSAEALVAAGLVPPGHFPGWPGMRKVRVTIFADGTVPTGAPMVGHARAREPGTRRVERAPAGKFLVMVSLPEDEEAKRWAEHDRARAAYEAQVRSMPRPAPLVDLPNPSDDRRERLAVECLNAAIAHWGADVVVARVHRLTGRADGIAALSEMGMLHRRKLPPGWRVIEGQGHA